MLGETYPAETAFAPDQERAVQKAFFDHMWDRPLAEIAASIDSYLYTRQEDLEVEAEALTVENARHREALTSFERLLEQEFHGVALTLVERAPDLGALVPGARAAGFDPLAIITNALREMLKSHEHARQLPTAHVHAVLHSLFRWEYRDKAMTANDLVDFRHAAAAISACGLMLVEGELGRTLTHKRLSVAEVHGRTVISDRLRAGEVLQQMLE